MSFCYASFSFIIQVMYLYFLLFEVSTSTEFNKIIDHQIGLGLIIYLFYPNLDGLQIVSL